MAEFVELRTERMVPELEKLQEYRIFNDMEICKIIRMRKSFQYKIQRRQILVDDYLQCIQYEMDLLKLVKIRRIKLGLVEKKHEVDMIIARRVNKLFRRALDKFRDDINLWLSYMKFCKQIKIFKVLLSNQLVAMLAVHNSKPSIWKLAANWEFEENNSIDNALQFIMRGLRHHPSSKMLFEEAFRLELIYTERKRKDIQSEGTKLKQGRQVVLPSASSVDPVPGCSNTLEVGETVNSVEEPSKKSLQSKLLQWQDAVQEPDAFSSATENESVDPVIDCQHVKFIYENAIKRIPDASFLISFLNIAKMFHFTENLQFAIMRDLLKHFSNDELTWHTLAQLELEGVNFFSDNFSNTDEDKLKRTEDSVPHCAAKTESEKLHYSRIKNCFTVYQHGLRHLNTERMWELYMDALIEINQDLHVLKKVKRKLLFSAFQSAHDADHLQEKHYVHWGDICGVDTENFSSVLRRATEKFPSNAQLWQMLLRFHIVKDQDQNVMDVFRCATASLGCKACVIPIWKMVIQYWETKSVDKVKELFEDGVKQGPPASSSLKQMYLEWLVSAKDIHAARIVYDTLCWQPPFCCGFHKKMIELECLQPELKRSRVTRCYELACLQFGKSDPDIWMEHIKFEAKRGDPKKIQKIHQRASKMLDKELVQQFISIFCDYWYVHKFEN